MEIQVLILHEFCSSEFTYLLKYIYNPQIYIHSQCFQSLDMHREKPELLETHSSLKGDSHNINKYIVLFVVVVLFPTMFWAFTFCSFVLFIGDFTAENELLRPPPQRSNGGF